MSQSDQIDELFAALSAAQGKIEGAKKDQKNPHFKTKFAGLSATWDACRAALAENGLAVVQTTMPTSDGLFLVTTLGHKSGQWIRGETPLYMDRQGMQPLGSAITYARRYGLQGVTGIAPIDDDAEDATEHNKKEPVFGKLTKTKLQAKMREFDTDLHAVEDIDSLEGLLAAYREDLDQCERDLRSWYYTKSGSETLGIQDRILAKRAELEKTEREGPAPEGPQEPPGSPRTGLVYILPDGKPKDYAGTKAGAMAFLSDLEIAANMDPNAWEANKATVGHLIETATDKDVKARAMALENAMEQTELAGA